MADSAPRVLFVAGASSGIGRDVAERFAGMGYHVYGGSRRVAESGELHDAQNGGFAKFMRLDVRDQASVDAAVSCVMQAESRIDGVVMCAGYALAGAVEDTTPEEAWAQFDTNFLGALRLFRAVLPKMREQKSGTIVVIGSVAGFVPLPFQAMYSASKYALAAMTESLRMEVEPFGIRVCLVEPGDINTGFTSSRMWVSRPLAQSAYAKRCKRAVESMQKSEMHGLGPKCVTDVVVRLMRQKRPPVRVVVGVQYKAVAVLKRLLPDGVVHAILKKLY